MKVAFYSTGAEQLGVEMLGAVARRDGHAVKVVFDPALFGDSHNLDLPVVGSLFSVTDAKIGEIASFEPDVVAFSPVTPTYRACIRVAAGVKRLSPGSRVIMGGAHVSAVPETVLAEGCVDAVCLGEGDDAFAGYLAGCRGKTPDAAAGNIWLKRPDGVTKGRRVPLIEQLDSLPFADKSLYENSIDLSINYLAATGRGCPFRCSFCSGSLVHGAPGGAGGKRVRKRSPENVIEELKRGLKRYGFRHVEFVDDTFTADQAWLGRFLPLYRREINRPYSCMTHPRLLKERAAALLAGSGCDQVQVGVESMDEGYRRSVLNRPEKNSEIEEAFELLNRHRLSFSADHILGLPGEPGTALEAAFEMYARHRPARINTFWLVYYPGTGISLRALGEGWISEEEAAKAACGDLPSYHAPGARETGEDASYELAFKAMPLLGPELSMALSMWTRRHASAKAVRLASIAADAASCASTGNVDFFNYVRHYADQITRRLTGHGLSGRMTGGVSKGTGGGR